MPSRRSPAACARRRELLGLAAVALAIGVSYWLIREPDDRFSRAQGERRARIDRLRPLVAPGSA